ncbi:MAG: class IV adenylate cyclase [Chitinophagaceae bacterium]|nr:class IV adenylate cyclase [Chitinophagaceae bacterium]
MSYINIEIKARTNRTEEIRKFLLEKGADYKGLDTQTDTYFNVLNGRLKLRQGNIENNLIFYTRDNLSGPRQSDFDLAEVKNSDVIRSILTKALGVKIIVTKKREIYFIGNIKFHLDTLDGLGEFVEIEATDKNTSLPVEKLHEQCHFYMTELGIEEKDLVPLSYSDILLGTL